MNANPTLLQMKFARVVDLFSQYAKLPLSDSLTFFYGSELYPLIKNGISDMHCMSDEYLAEELLLEYQRN